MSDCQFPDQCGFPNCFCVGFLYSDKTKRMMSEWEVKGRTSCTEPLSNETVKGVFKAFESKMDEEVLQYVKRTS